MSVVTVQLGQCGNQIGYEVFDAICRDLHSTQGFCSKKENEVYQASCKEHFFNEDKSEVPVARALLIDMEPKVISQTLLKAAHSGRWKYGQHSHFCQKQGSGNNWAYGYNVHGPKHEESIMNLIQREVEEYDSLSGFSIIMSMAGGTGSGLGAFLTQNLRDAYPNSFIMNQVIWPYGTGEVIVQNYNSVLTLSHLYRSSDALLVHENDVVHKICAKLMNIKQISFRDVNQVIAHQLGSVFQPTYSSEDSFQYRRNPLGGFKDPALYTSWLQPSDAFCEWRTHRAFNKYEKSAALVSNSQFLLKPLDTIVGKAWNMFASKAYVHQYTKFGIEEEDFLDSFTVLEQVVASYCNL
ncbi:tubulin delta chain isoform X4 [Gracilinanus agilis]|uniref:tubulin delta chain isoform X4 n=1 Tax=Gracilinanus agilis TaxID=191870 RepID=UPI001CFF10BD|nr:tubulin delta chain isoform X4 [Gracilinanus agilis]